MMNKCTDSAENAAMGGFSNNQYNFSEKKNESSYAARIEKEKLFLTQKLSPSSHDRPDFVNLQEVNGLTSIDKGDTPIIKKSFLQEMDKLGYGALYSKSRNLNAKPLITLYRTDRYELHPICQTTKQQNR